jgi:hypothetical protein
MRKPSFVLALLAAAFAAAPAGAITLENYQKYRVDTRSVNATYKSLLEVRMEGLVHGLVLASKEIQAAGGRPFVCPPADARIRGVELVKMLDDELKAPSRDGGKPYAASTQVEEVLVALVRKNWACR